MGNSRLIVQGPNARFTGAKPASAAPLAERPVQAVVGRLITGEHIRPLQR